MQKLILLLVFGLTLLTPIRSVQQDEFPIAGTWAWEQFDSEGKIIFDKDGFLQIIPEKERKNGKLVPVEGVKINFSYSIDWNTTPINLDMLGYDNQSQSDHLIQCIIEIIDKDRIYMGMPNEDGLRPKKIADSDDRMVLERVN